MRRIGSLVARSCGLRGLFGCDFLYDGRQVWLTEVNPRYTASVEIFEHAWGRPLLAWHAQVCRDFNDSPPPSGRGSATPCGSFERPPSADSDRTVCGRTVVGKMILYAPVRLTVPPLPEFAVDARRLQDEPFSFPWAADIPAAGSVIEAGRPICTVFARGPSVAECQAALAENVGRFSERLFGDKLLEP